MRWVRFVVLGIVTVCLTQILANQNTYNFTKICVDNVTDASAHYNSMEQSIIQASPAIGALAASVPLTIAMEHLPKKYVFLVAGVISTIATAVIPYFETLGSGSAYFLAARVFQGIACCITFPMAGTVTAEWASLTEHGIFLAFLTGFTQLANIYLMPVAGLLCSSSHGWRSVYYFMAASGLIAFGLFAFFFEDRPTQHRMITDEEKKWIMKGRHEKSHKREPVPYRAIFSSLTIWGVWISGFADILAIQFINMFNPQYLKDYLNFNVLNTGFLGAIPVLVMWGCKLFAGVSSDLMKCIHEDVKLKIYNSIALGVSGLFFIILSFIPNTQPALCLVILILTEGFIGFNTAGFNKCGTLHARQHAHFIMIMIVNISSLCVLVEPFIVNNILTENTPFQWGMVFWVHAILLMIATILFICWADSRPAPWTNTVEHKEHKVPFDDGPFKAPTIPELSAEEEEEELDVIPIS